MKKTPSLTKAFKKTLAANILSIWQNSNLLLVKTFNSATHSLLSDFVKTRKNNRQSFSVDSR